MSRFFKSAVGKASLALGAAAGGTIIYLDFIQPKKPAQIATSYKPLKKDYAPPPTREELVSRLTPEKKFDVLIIGGGAVGSGCAVDAATRGLNVCLLEKTDFGSGTSSKSTDRKSVV